MSVFADSSALVKLYADEAGYQSVRALRDAVVSCLARVEVPAAIWRKQRTGEIKVTQAALLVADFEADYFGDDVQQARFTVLSLPPRILNEAGALTARHGLQAYDAVQLASAMAAREVDPSCDAVACFDEELRAGATIEGFGLIPPEA